MIDAGTVGQSPRAPDAHVDVSLSPPAVAGSERRAFKSLDPEGFYIRHPPPPHELDTFITPDDLLFQTIHLGAAVVDTDAWLLTIDGLVNNPFSLTLPQLQCMPSKTITAFHECYGSPVKPPIEALRRVGNVTWTGVPLRTLLLYARPASNAAFVWSEGLDSGEFFGFKCDKYQKDLPIDKAMADEVLIAYEINGKPLSKKRGGPVRLVVPGWFGTNSTKWLCRLTLQDERAPGLFTTVFYNELDPTDLQGQRKRPVWAVEVNSIITRPTPDETVTAREVLVEGWAWSHDGVLKVEIKLNDHDGWSEAKVETRTALSWQRFSTNLPVSAGRYNVTARATSFFGAAQPLKGRRNHVHSIPFTVQ